MNTDDKIAIMELLARSAYTLDEREVDALRDTFTEDAALAIDIAGADGEVQFEGRDAILSLMTDSMAEQTDQRRHVVSNSFFAHDGGDTVTVVSNITITSVENGAARLVTTGLYRDTVRRESDVWRIATRRIELDLAY